MDIINNYQNAVKLPVYEQFLNQIVLLGGGYVSVWAYR